METECFVRYFFLKIDAAESLSYEPDRTEIPAEGREKKRSKMTRPLLVIRKVTEQ